MGYSLDPLLPWFDVIFVVLFAVIGVVVCLFVVAFVVVVAVNIVVAAASRVLVVFVVAAVVVVFGSVCFCACGCIASVGYWLALDTGRVECLLMCCSAAGAKLSSGYSQDHA